MKYQLARVLATARDVPGFECWAEAGPPRVPLVRCCETVAGGLDFTRPTHQAPAFTTNIHDDGVALMVRANQVELLPHFDDDVEPEPFRDWVARERKRLGLEMAS